MTRSGLLQVLSVPSRLSACVALASVAWGSTVTAPSAIARIDSGEVAGVVLDADANLVAFRGIPFAKPPVGELRWKPPHQVSSWKGVRQCRAFGPACLQRKNGVVLKDGSEDCLYLNVWTTTDCSESKRPVMVWIHGGGLTSGSGHKPSYRGSNFARNGVVVVTINYRLGPLGFLAHPALSAESAQSVSGNYGILDQIAALKWVRSNIEAFGGDPNNVTIFGESAGGTSVAVLCSSPRARGLFHRAILQSPWMFGYVNKLAEPVIVDLKQPSANAASSERLGVEWARQFTDFNNAEAIANLRSVDAKKLVRGNGYYKARVTIDGWLLPDHPERVFASGQQANVPLMIGTTKDEGNLFIRMLSVLTPSDFNERLGDFYGPATDSVRSLFPGETPQEMRSAMSRYITEAWFGLPARRLLRGMQNVSSPAYQYEFTQPAWWNPKLGAMHAGEIGYVFNTLNQAKVRDDDIELAQTMMRYWINFALSGNPNADGRPLWPEYDEQGARYLELGGVVQPGDRLRHKVLDQLDAATNTVDIRANRAAIKEGER